MLELYSAPTSNGFRALLALEACEESYRLIAVDLMRGEQREPAFLALNPRGQIPVLVDPGDAERGRHVLTQSAAILLHMAERSGRYLPNDGPARMRTLQWLMQAMTDTAAASFAIAATERFIGEPSPAAQSFFERRLVSHLQYIERRLADAAFLAGGDLTVADLALYPVVHSRQDFISRNGGFQAIESWFRELSEQPFVARAMAAFDKG